MISLRQSVPCVCQKCFAVARLSLGIEFVPPCGHALRHWLTSIDVQALSHAVPEQDERRRKSQEALIATHWGNDAPAPEPAADRREARTLLSSPTLFDEVAS